MLKSPSRLVALSLTLASTSLVARAQEGEVPASNAPADKVQAAGTDLDPIEGSEGETVTSQPSADSTAGTASPPEEDAAAPRDEKQTVPPSETSEPDASRHPERGIPHPPVAPRIPAAKPHGVEEQELEEVDVAIAARTYKPWEEVGDTKYDWIRTTSGEWLKGELKELRDDNLTIDSDEFDLQTLSWSDISDLHSPNRFVYVLEDQSIHTGPAEMASGKLVVHTDMGRRVFARKRVMSIVPESTHELGHWSFRLTLGATASMGNSDKVDYSAYSRIRREDPFNRATAEYQGAYGLVSEELNTNRHRGNASWNIFVSPIFYITPLSGELLYDRFQNIQLRALALTGLGAHAIDTSDVTLDMDAAGGYVRTQYLSTQDVDDNVQKDALAVPQLHMEWDITDDVEFEFNWMTALVVTHIERSFHRANSTLSIDITDIFDLDLAAIYSRQESPVTDDDGVTPKKTDLTVTVGVGLDID